MMKVVAILQNMWFEDPERAMQVMAYYQSVKGEHDGRERFIRDMLFLGCLTGRRLRDAFTWDVCAEIVWEEASREIGGYSSSKFKHDASHVADVIGRHRPSVVLAFGKIAESAVEDAVVVSLIDECGATIIKAPHPAARGASVVPLLKAAADRLSGLAIRSDQ